MPQGGVGKNEGGTACPKLAHYDPALLWAPGNKASQLISESQGTDSEYVSVLVLTES